MLLVDALALALAVSPESARGAAEGNGTDRAFVAAMVPHHRSAVEMAPLFT